VSRYSAHDQKPFKRRQWLSDYLNDGFLPEELDISGVSSRRALIV